MKTKIPAVIFSMMFLFFFPLVSYAGALEAALEMIEFKRKEINCREEGDGLWAEICVKKAWLELQQNQGSLGISDQPDRELIEMSKRYFQERWQMEQDYKKQTVSFDEDLAYCRFQKAEASLKNTVMTFARRYPDSIVVMDAKDEKGYAWGKVNAKKSELANAENAASMATADGAKSREFCIAWDVPPTLLAADVLVKCRPNLLAQMTRVSGLSRDAERGFKQFKVQRDESIQYAQRCVTECRDLQGSLERLKNLNPYPYNKCAEFMLKQEAGPDASEYVKKNIDSRQNDLVARRDRINQILPLTNNVILNCDWNTLGRMKQDALQALPEENCIRNYPVFGTLRNSINDLDRKREARINELRPLAVRMLKNIKLCEGYLKISPVNPNSPYNQPGWDENRVKLYNEERTALDFAVRESFTLGCANCLKDLIARANVLPLTLQATARPGRRFDNPMLSGRPLDHCLAYAANCDKPAGDAFCKRNGFQTASGWKVASVAKTNIPSGQKCDAPSRCDAFSYVICE